MDVVGERVLYMCVREWERREEMERGPVDVSSMWCGVVGSVQFVLL